jgi:hypothetical protein
MEEGYIKNMEYLKILDIRNNIIFDSHFFELSFGSIDQGGDGASRFFENVTYSFVTFVFKIMQDNNILDHNAYSKYFFEWVSPIVVDGSEEVTTITLDPFESSGDFILINDNWNGSPYDEYLLIEFYTPTGLNYMDSINGPYGGVYPLGFTIPGIKILHVDSRLGRYSNSSFLGYTDSLPSLSNEYANIAASNTASRSQNRDFKLIHLLEADGVNSFKNGFDADNSTLFLQGSVFTPSTFSSFFPVPGKFNSGESINYSITVTSMTSTSATITIERLSS